jgi:hypothetical protein
MLIRGSQSFSLFLPSIIAGLGHHATQAPLFTVPPNMAAFLTVLLTSTLSDKIKARGPIMAAGTIIAMCGYVMLLVAERNTVRYGGTFLVAVGVYPGSAMIMVSMIHLMLFFFISAADCVVLGLDVK